jgi:hypothetical protein
VPIDLKLLNFIKEGLDVGEILCVSKKAVWALSLAVYWGLFRLGEILPTVADRFDRTTVLLWKDVILLEEKVVFHIKLPKTRTNQGKTVVLYKLLDGFLPGQAFVRTRNFVKAKRVVRSGPAGIPEIFGEIFEKNLSLSSRG